MSTVKSYPSVELSRLRREWLRRNRGPVLLVGAFFVAAVGASTWWGFTFSNSGAWYVVGLLHAGVAATFLHLLNSAILAHEPRAVFQLRGAWGEDNTRSELQSARQRRLIWGWVDSITFRSGDLDHVVVTREGGVVVLDSKFRTDVTQTSIVEMTKSARRARTRAEGIARTVLGSDRSGRRRASATSVTVTPCIVVWGPASRDVPDGHVVDGVHFVSGRKLKQWLAQLPPSSVSREAADDLLERLAAWRERARASEG
jgi:hypothetical protein